MRSAERMPPLRPVLAADDYAHNLMVISLILEPLGIEVVAASSGAEAVALAAVREYAAILLDVRMPGLSGVEAAAQIRAGATNRETPILLLTGEDERSDRLVGREFEVLSKPYKASALVDKVQPLLARFDARHSQGPAPCLDSSDEG